MATISENSMYGVSIQLKCKNAADWGNSDVLLAGEIGFELDTQKAKLGDGHTTWGELGYYSDPVVSGLITALTERVRTNEGDISGLGTRMTAAENVNTQQGTDITALQGRMSAAETVNASQQTDIDALKGIVVISANPAPTGN